MASVPRESAAESFRDDEDADQDSSEPEPSKLWPVLVEAIMEDRPGLGSFLSMSHVAGISAKSLDIRFPARCSFQFAEVTKKSNREFVEKMLARKAGKPLDLHITLEKPKKEDSSESTEKPPTASRHMLPSLEDDIENEPIIKNVLEMFDGEVV